MQHRHSILAILANLVVSVTPTMYPSWRDARAGVVHDTLYIQGGLFGSVLSEGVFAFDGAGLARFNFSTKFDAHSNFTDVFLLESMNFSNTDAKPHVGGFMFADYDEWYAFGGRACPSYKHTSNLTEIIYDALYIPNAAATAAPLGLAESADYLPAGNGTNRYITNGAGVSAPSESLGFYFSGLHSDDNSEMNFNDNNRSSSTFPSVLADSMLMVDTHNFGASVWTELPLPAFVTPRAEAVLSWIPVGARGVVIVIGGVPFPASLDQGCNVTSYPQAANNSAAAGFMTSLSIFDVASQTWYSQDTNGNVSPPPLAQACAVVATSGNVHNIYVYGGYSGNDGTSTSDDVWILSVPAFTWTKVSSSSPSHGRYSHVCAQPYPDQMMIVGGVSGCGVPLETPAFADVFNLSTLSWTGSYDPAVWSEYVIPTQISNAIKASPTASMVAGLASIFNTQYTSTQQIFYPYNTTNNSSGNNSHNGSHGNHKSSLPTWAIAVIAIVAVLAVIAAGTTVWYCRRGDKGRSTSQSTRTGRRSVMAWVRGNPPPPLTVTSEDDMTQVDNTPHGVYEVDSYFKRIPQTQVAELTANDSQINSPSLDSPFGSPRGPVSPSSPSSAELYTPPARYELPGNFIHNPNITSHPLFPHNISGDASTVHSPRSVSSPLTEPITPYELPRKRSDEDILSQPNDLDLNDPRLSRSGLHSSTPKSPRLKAVDMSGSVSPDFSATSVSPDQAPTRLPTTPPTQPINKLTNSITKHTRNTSSLSSTLPDLQSPTPLEDQRRSVHIATLPDSPHTTTSIYQPLSPMAEATSEADPNPTSPQRPAISPIASPDRKAQLDQQVRRKELQNWAPGKSAYHENEDMYGGRGDTV